MRVGIDASFLRSSSLHTGMGVYTSQLLAALAPDTSHEIVLLGYGDRPPAAPDRLPWHALPPLPAGKASPWLSHQAVLPRAARRLGLDLLHIPGVNLRLSQPGVPFAAPCPLVVTLHDAIPLVYYGRQGPALPWRLRLGYRVALRAIGRAAAVITVSATSRRDILAHLRLRPARVHVVHNGLAFPPRPPRSRALALLAERGVVPPYLLYAGSFEPRKNLLATVAAYRQAATSRDLPPLVLVVERESGYRAAVMEEVARSGVADRLIFLHSLPDEALAALYYHADLLVYPSRYEGFGFVPLQGLACGIPVIASHTGALPEILGDAAHYIDPASVNEIAGAIGRLVADREAAAALAARGPAQAARFTWALAAERTLAVYHRAMAQGR